MLDRRCIIGVLLAFMVIPPAWAMRWELIPQVQFSQAYTDNVNLEPKGQEDDDYITQVNPAFNFKGTGRHLKTDLFYQMQNIFYQKTEGQQLTDTGEVTDEDNPQTIHKASAAANWEVLRRTLYLDASASLDQENRDFSGPISQNNIARTNQRTDVQTLRAGPTYVHSFQNTMRYRLGYGYESNTLKDAFDPGEASDRDFTTIRQAFNTSLDSNRMFARLTSQLFYTYEIHSYDRPEPDTILQRTKWRNVFKHSERLVTKLDLSYVDNDYPVVSPGTEQTDGLAALLGWTYRPGSRTNVSVAFGYDPFGDLYEADISHRFHRLSFSMKYNVTNSLLTAGEPGFLAETEQNQEALPELDLTELTSLGRQSYVKRRGELGVNLNGLRLRLGLSGYSEERDYGAIETIGIESRVETYYGGIASMKYLLGARTSLSVSFERQKGRNINDFNFLGDSEDVDDQTVDSATLRFSRQIRPNVSFDFAFNHNQQGSEDDPDSVYKENVAQIMFNMQF